MANPLSLSHAPPRIDHLSLLDVVLGFTLTVAGILIASAVATLMMSADPGAQQLEFETPLQAALFSAAGTLLTTGLAAAYFVFRAAAVDDGLRRAGLVPRRPGRDAIVAAVASFVIIPAVFLLSIQVAQLLTWLGYPPPAIGHTVLTQMTENKDPAAKWVMICTAVVLAPVLEEVVYRGLVHSSLRGTMEGGSRWLVIVVAAAVFAGIHASAAVWQAMPALLALGLALGWLYERTGSLWPPIVVHMAFNAVNIAVALSVAGAEAGAEGAAAGAG